jgi:hypothetical protein
MADPSPYGYDSSGSTGEAEKEASGTHCDMKGFFMSSSQDVAVLTASPGEV